ncbi:hypothetical protein BH10CYA1_BH10CYA1_51320 [soil metagenome]
MNGRNTAEFRKVDAAHHGEKTLNNASSTSRDIKRSSELCQNGVCAITWKPGKPAAA